MAPCICAIVASCSRNGDGGAADARLPTPAAANATAAPANSIANLRAVRPARILGVAMFEVSLNMALDGKPSATPTFTLPGCLPAGDIAAPAAPAPKTPDPRWGLA